MHNTIECHQEVAGLSRGPVVGQRWVRFLVGVLAILVFAFGLIPQLQRWGPVRDVRDAIRDTGIDAAALFYTESEVSCQAEMSIRDAIRYSAEGRP